MDSLCTLIAFRGSGVLSVARDCCGACDSSGGSHPDACAPPAAAAAAAAASRVSPSQPRRGASSPGEMALHGARPIVSLIRKHYDILPCACLVRYPVSRSVDILTACIFCKSSWLTFPDALRLHACAECGLLMRLCRTVLSQMKKPPL